MRTPSDTYKFVPEELPTEFQNALQGTDVFPYQGTMYEYGIMDASVAPIHYGVGMPNGQNLFAFSTIPPHLLPFYLGHEIQCHRVRAPEKGRCVSIEQNLLEQVDPNIRQELLQARRRTFESIVSAYDIDLESPANSLFAEIAETTRFLRQQLSGL